MKEDSPVKPPPRRWWRWLKRILWAVLALVVLLVIFHRPLLRLAVQKGGPAFAKSEGMEMTWDVNGSVTGDIDITNVKVTGDAKAPLQKLTAKRIKADYSLWSLVKKGVGPFVGGTEAELEDVDLVLDTNKLPPPKEEKEEPSPPPALELPTLKLKNVNARIILADGEVVLRGLNFTLLPGSNGVFEFADLQLPQGLPRLQNVKGTTEAETKKFTLKALQLMPDLKVDALSVDLADLDKSKLAFATALTVPGGSPTGAVAAGPGNQRAVAGNGAVNISGTFDGIGKETQSLDITATLTKLTPATLQPWVQLPPDMDWNVPEIKATVSGNPGDPRALKANVTASVAGFSMPGAKIDTVQLDAALEKGTLTVRQVDIAKGANHLVAKATGQLPASWDAFDKFELKAEADVNAPQVEAFFPGTAPVSGALNGKLNATLANGALTSAQANLRGSALKVQIVPAEPVDPATGRTEASKPVDLPVESVELAANTDGKTVTLDKVKVSLDPQNTVEASGTLGLEGAQAVQLKWSADLPNVEHYSKLFATPEMPALDSGWLKAAGQVNGNLGDWTKEIPDFSKTMAETKITAGNITVKSGRMESLVLDTALKDGEVMVRDFSAIMNDRNKITATGVGKLTTPWQFSGKVNGDLSQLEDFQPWLDALGVKGPISGKVKIAWEGSGQAGDFNLTGGGTISVEAFKFADMKEPAVLMLKTSHTGKAAEIATLELAMGDLKVIAPGKITATSFEAPSIKVTAGKLAPVEGRIKVPLDFDQKGGPAGPVSIRENLDIALNVKEWDLAEVMRAAGLKPGPKGKVSADVKINGTLQNPVADMALNLKGVTMSDMKQKIAPTDGTVKVNLKEKKLSANVEVMQKPLQTLRARADLALDVEKLLAAPDPGALLKNEPLNAEVTLPDSDLNALKPFVEGISSISGKFGLNAKIGGTVGKPHITGSLHANSPAINFRSEDTPAIKNANVRIRFDGTRVFIEEAGAMMSGGTLGARGAVDWTNTENPTVDLTLTARQALVLRDDSISMRADGDITCRGTLQQSVVAGKVELVRGRVFKEIEFLPLSLPNSLPPPPPPVTTSTSGPPTLPPPLDKWIFNIDIVTREPIRLLGNVLNGGAVSALKVSGTGDKLALEGKVSLKDARVRLPFSRLAISRGDVIFTKDKPFEPVLDVQGDSFVNGYQVMLNAYGPALNPKIRFSSSPPLPEGEIATLLATGSTSGDLKGSEGEAANRAAFLVISKLYRKLFRKGALAKEDDEPPRLSFSFSPLNSSGGSGRSFSAIYEINKHLQAVGGMSQRGTFRGLLYYLIRFR